MQNNPVKSNQNKNYSHYFSLDSFFKDIIYKKTETQCEICGIVSYLSWRTGFCVTHHPDVIIYKSYIDLFPSI